MRVAVILVVGFGCACACGRIGYDERIVEPAEDASPPTDDASPPDVAAAGCATGMTLIANGSSVCIEQVERGTETWTNAKATCEGLGRRLCADLEWATACSNATGLVDMANDGGGANPEWEWMAEETAGEALKRGFDACGATSSHEIFIDPYDYRCCADI